MITSLRLKDFKNFADETLRAGPFTVIVGANASGKSNIRDAFRFLHGVGRGYTLAEIVEGKHGAGGQPEWEPIRGADNETVRIDKSMAAPPSPSPGFGLQTEFTLEGEAATHLIEVSRERGGADSESPVNYCGQAKEPSTRSLATSRENAKPFLGWSRPLTSMSTDLFWCSFWRAGASRSTKETGFDRSSAFSQTCVFPSFRLPGCGNPPFPARRDWATGGRICLRL